MSTLLLISKFSKFYRIRSTEINLLHFTVIQKKKNNKLKYEVFVIIPLKLRDYFTVMLNGFTPSPWNYKIADLCRRGSWKLSKRYRSKGLIFYLLMLQETTNPHGIDESSKNAFKEILVKLVTNNCHYWWGFHLIFQMVLHLRCLCDWSIAYRNTLKTL